MTIARDGGETEIAGLGYPAVMRAWLIQGPDRPPGRRGPDDGLQPPALSRGGPRRRSRGRGVARLRYQQTKIDGAPETILVGPDVVQIIREQQAWVREHWRLGPGETVRYLFPKLAGNRKGTRAWTTSY